MLQSRNRLQRPADVGRVRRHGRSWRHPLAILLVQSNDSALNRFAFIASRRVGNAVKRNRAKRLLRESVRHYLPEMTPGWDCILIARRALVQADFVEADTAVGQLLRRAKLFRDFL